MLLKKWDNMIVYTYEPKNRTKFDLSFWYFGHFKSINLNQWQLFCHMISTFTWNKAQPFDEYHFLVRKYIRLHQHWHKSWETHEKNTEKCLQFSQNENISHFEKIGKVSVFFLKCSQDFCQCSGRKSMNKIIAKKVMSPFTIICTLSHPLGITPPRC